MGNKSTFNIRRIALGGILAALTVTVLFVEAVAPVNKLSLYALSSFFVSIVIIELGVASGWLFYAVTCLLAFLITPDKLALIPYLVFFGLYGIVKYYIEKLDKLIPEYILKILFFNLVMAGAVLLAEKLMLDIVKLEFPWWIVAVVFEVVFLVYDYVYTLFIRYYSHRLRRFLSK
jgi:hypothetical protein